MNEVRYDNKSYILTPLSKDIYDSATEKEKERLIDSFKEDDKKIELENLLNNKNDPDYIFEFENPSAIGFYLESWIAVNYPCPICSGKLKKYVLYNMPIIDLVCNNKFHTNEMGVKFFQVKSSEDDSIVPKDNKKYFSSLDKYDKYDENGKEGYIHTGSKKYGYNAHVIKSNDSIDKKQILIGYICINYTKKETKLTINNSKSFILLPKTSKNDSNDTYYKYIHNSNSMSVIT